MNFYTDKMLLEQRLDLNPPLHPRRTLDQYYYWALKDIERQDKSQVVYRATAPKKHALHITDQWSKRDLNCRECLKDMRTVPRLLMVDQLWLWILDGRWSPLLCQFAKIFTEAVTQIQSLHSFRRGGEGMRMIILTYIADFAPGSKQSRTTKSIQLTT